MDWIQIVTLIGGGGLTAWNTHQTKQLTKMRAEIDSLTSWRLIALGYIGTLLFLISERGITAPPPPAGLGLSVAVDKLPKGI